jgi:hypothetical protein
MIWLLGTLALNPGVRLLNGFSDNGCEGWYDMAFRLGIKLGRGMRGSQVYCRHLTWIMVGREEDAERGDVRRKGGSLLCVSLEGKRREV